MSKAFITGIGIVLVVVAAFAIGRWTAPESNSPNLADPSIGQLAFGSNSSEHLHESPVSNTGGLPPAATHPIKSSYATDYTQMQSLLLLAATNPQLAMERAQKFKGAIKTKAEAAILDVWASHDPYGAWAWVESFQPGNSVQFINLLESIGRHEPQTAITYAEKYADTHRELRKDIYLSALNGITQAGAYQAAASFVDHLDIESAIKAELVNYLAAAWGTYEPQAAMQWIKTQPEELKSSAGGRLSEAWAESDPQGATHFAAAAETPDAEPILQNSFSKWLAADSAAATAWLAAAPNKKELDPLLNEVATMPAQTNGQVKTALSWAERIQDPELRLNTVTSILSAFKQQDSAAAAAYLQDITYLTDEQRVRLVDDLAFGK